MSDTLVPASEKLFADLSGSVVDGRYQLVRLVGRGGMGVVYEGKNLKTHKRVAVKLLTAPELTMRPDLVRRFFQEARAGSIVESEHVVEVFDSGSDATLRAPYMVMELLAGEDLDAAMKRVGVLPPRVAAKIVLQAATGLAKAHALGIVHRDIKPANLFLTRRETGELLVKLLDFGVAKVRTQHFHETQSALTRTGSLLGTPIYMSPEQARGSSAIDARSDVWSLGVVLYELLSGQLPYSNVETLGELIICIGTEDVTLLQTRAPWVPPELAEITHRAMSRALDKRFADAGQLRDALHGVLSDGGWLTPEMLVSLPLDERDRVAPRLKLMDDTILRTRSRGGMAVTQPDAALGSARSWLVSGAALLSAATVSGAVVWRLARSPAPAPSAAHSTTPPALVVSAPAPVVPPAQAPKSYLLQVTPRQARASLDGQAVSVGASGVEVSGLPGEVKRLRLEHKGRSLEVDVAVTGSGLVPPSIELEASVSPQPAHPVKRPTSSAPPAATGLAPSKPKLESDWP